MPKKTPTTHNMLEAAKVYARFGLPAFLGTRNPQPYTGPTVTKTPHHRERRHPRRSRGRLNALTTLMTDAPLTPPKGTHVGLRYLRDRISVPRDMSIYAARRLRTALEATAARAGEAHGPPIPVRHRRDQDPAAFRAA